MNLGNTLNLGNPVYLVGRVTGFPILARYLCDGLYYWLAVSWYTYMCVCCEAFCMDLLIKHSRLCIDILKKHARTPSMFVASSQLASTQT
jgi:hypothetical protein